MNVELRVIPLTIVIEYVLLQATNCTTATLERFVLHLRSDRYSSSFFIGTHSCIYRAGYFDFTGR